MDEKTVLDNTCISMDDFNINLLKSHASNVTLNFLEATKSFSYAQQPTRVVGSSSTPIGNIFHEFYWIDTVSGKL